MEGQKSTHEVKRDIIAELYKNGPESAHMIWKNTGLAEATVYNNLKRELAGVVDVKTRPIEEKNGYFGKRVREYSLKKEYAAGIKACEDLGIDILDLVSYPKE